MANDRVSTGLFHLEIEIDHPLEFLPGQFAMLNLTGPQKRTFGRPFSILSCTGDRIAFLYRVVGGGTADLATLIPGREMTVLGPLGKPFPAPAEDRPAILLAGGVGLPPILAWWHRYARPDDRAFFGGRDPGDLPSTLLPAAWGVSVDAAGEPVGDAAVGRPLWTGRVTELAERNLPAGELSDAWLLACGPLPLLAAASRWADARGWECFVSMEEHMGCGYGACKGCVIPVHSADLSVASESPADAWRNATCCQEGPVFRAETILWDRIQ